MSGLKDTGALSTADAHQNERSGSGDVGHKSKGTSLFSGMNEYKRDPNNAAGAARRESIQDQSARSGVLGNLWNSTFKGTSTK
ncbi:hypothetical protein CLAFUW4_09949 [Fulvia fulva]|uniref:Uncharacterized protein n=1 Tax=Passalora fulva TaxID=5499 RepID=A0A9Q8PIM6_PASFU|nr:uncharacterized protein CLAFUR5_12294 [Fulvia fulva]KAK4615522.1 hypothetical protein CLAFUR4_09953 [Fulvia fulva]KAK4616679.1 hypothetical protein CLAFUR0_09950 [Fulvia fulva]UJO23107.1 hypothetical protein CLAFUR5_12294 [Fulvia fulva]WPV19059.1 hypothetical protein CLAFUW4_09949 [Fulvia fulva]WPV33773.1 hypothetical protein CLAFUW7_09950 [Fulvia fulva]